jgi:hypothetical protein
VLIYRKKYEELKNTPNVPDTVLVEDCEQLVLRYDNYVEILKANVLSYKKLSDTLQLENTYLDQAYGICVTLSADQKEELAKTRNKLKRSKI